MSGPALAWHQFRYDQKIFWRNPASVFFTVMFPVVFLVLLGTIFGGQTLDQYGGIKVDTYYVPGILTLALVSATMVNLAMSLTIAREGGLLKRAQGTPLPQWVVIAGRVGNAIVVSLLMTVVVTAIGALVFGVDVPWSHALQLLATVAVGAASFCAIGVALTALIPSQEAAPPITNLCAMPLYFISGVFIPDTEIPDGVLHFASVLPMRPLFQSFFGAFVPAADGGGFEWAHLAVVATWGIGALLIAIRAFRWTPRSD